MVKENNWKLNNTSIYTHMKEIYNRHLIPQVIHQRNAFSVDKTKMLIIFDQCEKCETINIKEPEKINSKY